MLKARQSLSAVDSVLSLQRHQVGLSEPLLFMFSGRRPSLSLLDPFDLSPNPSPSTFFGANLLCKSPNGRPWRNTGVNKSRTSLPLSWAQTWLCPSPRPVHFQPPWACLEVSPLVSWTPMSYPASGILVSELPPPPLPHRSFFLAPLTSHIHPESTGHGHLLLQLIRPFGWQLRHIQLILAL